MVTLASAATPLRDEPISPDPVRSFEADYLPSYVSNGVVGMRVLEVPFRRGVRSFAGRNRVFRQRGFQWRFFLGDIAHNSLYPSIVSGFPETEHFLPRPAPPRR